MSKTTRLFAIALLCAGMHLHASADIYGYIDSDGVGHFATEQLDARYQLFMKGQNEFDSSESNSAVPPGKGPLFKYLSQHPNLKKYEPLLNQAAKDYAIDPALLKAVMAAESGFNPGAVSPKGAVGLMQVMPATAERYGLHADKKESVSQKLADPKTNIRLGARYLRDKKIQKQDSALSGNHQLRANRDAVLSALQAEVGSG
jgi:soluble lytic murein transglycosylase-like protein